MFRTWVKTLHADSACVQVGNVHWPTESCLIWNWCLCELCFIYCYTIDNRKWMFCPLHFANETRLCLYGLFFCVSFCTSTAGIPFMNKSSYIGTNEWMMHLYSALLCIVVHPKHFTIMGGGGLSWNTTSVLHPLGWCYSCHSTTAPVRSPHTSYRWRGERVIEIFSGWGLLGGHDRQGPVVVIWPGHRGYTPTLYENCDEIFNDHRESGPWFNISSERRCFLTV